jgi:hypothetical protein
MIINSVNYSSIYKLYVEFVRVKGQKNTYLGFIVIDTDSRILDVVEKFLSTIEPRRYSEIINAILIDDDEALQLRPNWFIIKEELKKLYDIA